jgi:hypothetical protein
LTATASLVAGYQIDRGRAYEFDRTDTGKAVVTINDREGVLDPRNSTTPYFGLLEPLLQIQIELLNPVTDVWWVRYRGFIEEFDYGVDPSTHVSTLGRRSGLTRLQISCVDLFEILTRSRCSRTARSVTTRRRRRRTRPATCSSTPPATSRHGSIR